MVSGRRAQAAVPANYTFRSIVDPKVVRTIGPAKGTAEASQPQQSQQSTDPPQPRCFPRLTWLEARSRVKEEVQKLRAMKPLALSQELLDPLLLAQKFLSAVGAASHLDVGFIDVLQSDDLNAIEPYLCQHWLDPPVYDEEEADTGAESEWASIKDIVAQRLAAAPSFIDDEAGATSFLQELLASLKGICFLMILLFACSLIMFLLGPTRLLQHAVRLLCTEPIDSFGDGPLFKYFSRSWDGIQTCHRSFQPHWSKEYPWLYYDAKLQLMFCLACKHFRKPGFGQGSTNFRLSTVREHCLPNRTVCCNYAAWQSALAARKLAQANEEVEREEENKKITQQFLCCYNTLVKEAPMSSYVQDLDLLEVRNFDVFELSLL